ncbi:hypothetical protein KCP74_13900 [Salmonella enterica subsp. enterica]|nr:hypothetical protein KCP74_13900 [Salmonella enterica subsp. enterica]
MKRSDNTNITSVLGATICYSGFRRSGDEHDFLSWIWRCGICLAGGGAAGFIELLGGAVRDEVQFYATGACMAKNGLYRR